MNRNIQSKRRVIIWVISAVVLIALFGAALYYFEHYWDKDGESDQSNAGSVKQTLYFGDAEYEVTHNLETYLLIGTDDSGTVKAEGTKKYKGQMADFLLLLVMDRTDNAYGFFQIDRNTMTDVPIIDEEGNGDEEAYEQICIANWYGGTREMGCDNTVYTVGELAGGLMIDGYYSVHMSDIDILNHAVGGVQVTIEDDMTSVDPAFQKGTTLVLNDKQAEEFVRARMSVGEGDNASRMRRQKAYMSAYHAKADQMLAEDPSFINDIYAALEDDAVTDMTENRISVIANQMYKGEDRGILTCEGETKEGDTLKDGEMHEEFYADTESIAQVMVKLCGIDEDHIIRYEEAEDDEDYEEEEDTGEEE